MGKKLDVATIFCAACIIIFTLVGERFGYGNFEYAGAKYFFILFSIVAAIVSWRDLKGKFKSGNLRLVTKFYNQGLVFNAKGDLDAAISNYKMALNMNPDFALAHNALGHAFFTKGKLNTSIEEFKKATKIDPNFGSAHCSLGAALAEAGKMKEAITEFKKAVDLEPDNANAREGLERARIEADQEELRAGHDGLVEGIYSNSNASFASIRYPHTLEGIRSINSKSDDVLCMAGRWSIVFGVIFALLAYFLAKNHFTFLFIFLSGIMIGNSIGFTTWLIKNNVKGAVSAVDQSAVIGGLIGYGVPYFMGSSSAWTTGMVGLIIGHRVGFALWHAKNKTRYGKDSEKEECKTYSNDKYGFSIKFPKGWEINNARLPPETLVHFVDSRGGTINLIAGPTYGTQESIEELENLAIRNVRRFRGKMESLKRIKVDGVEAIEAVYAIPLGIKTKKIGFNKGGVEYIITCGVRSVKFEEYEPIFDECIQSFKFNV